MAKKNSGLGRGLDAIFLDNSLIEESVNSDEKITKNAKKTGKIRYLDSKIKGDLVKNDMTSKLEIVLENKKKNLKIDNDNYNIWEKAYPPRKNGRSNHIVAYEIFVVKVIFRAVFHEETYTLELVLDHLCFRGVFYNCLSFVIKGNYLSRGRFGFCGVGSLRCSCFALGRCRFALGGGFFRRFGYFVILVYLKRYYAVTRDRKGLNEVKLEISYDVAVFRRFFGILLVEYEGAR